MGHRENGCHEARRTSLTHTMNCSDINNELILTLLKTDSLREL